MRLFNKKTFRVYLTPHDAQVVRRKEGGIEIETEYEKVPIIEDYWQASGVETARKTLITKSKPNWFRGKFGVVIFASLALMITIGLKMGPVITSTLEWKGRILGAAIGGLFHLESAEETLKQQNFDATKTELNSALVQFRVAQNELAATGVVLGEMLKVISQKQTADSMLEGMTAATEGAHHIASLASVARTLSFSPGGLAGAENVPSAVYKMRTEATLAAEKLDLALKNLESINPDHVPGNYQKQFIEAKTKLKVILPSVHLFADVLAVVNAITPGKHTVLLLMQNNNELRPTGGFIGTYGHVLLKDATITSLRVSSVYDLDGQIKDLFSPPRPLLAVSGIWGLRDSNWFIDFPTTARQASLFYERSGGETPDIVIALTPTLIESILNITGPIELSAYGVVLDSENFASVTQRLTSYEYDKVLNQPKAMLADFTPLLLQRIAALPTDEKVEVARVFLDSLEHKAVMLYGRNSEVGTILKKYRWDGSIAKTDRDYLNVNSANLNGSKTDLLIEDSYNLRSVISTDGAIENTLTITRKNSNAPSTPSSTNISFIRVLVPEGAVLKEVSGFDKKPPIEPLTNSKTDPIVNEWEKSLRLDLTTGTYIGAEADKTFFGNWLEVAAGKERRVTLTYSLPFKVGVRDRMSLLIQKQPGKEKVHFDWRVEGGQRKVIWKTSEEVSSDRGLIGVSIELVSDRFFGFVVEAEK